MPANRTSLSYAVRAARIAEQIRSRIGTGSESRSSYMEKAGEYYRKVIRLACEANRPTTAFWAFQRLQNRTFLDSIARQCVRRPKGVSQELYKKEQDLFARLRRAESNPVQMNETLAMFETFYQKEIAPYDAEYARWRMGRPLRHHTLYGLLERMGAGTAYLELVESHGTFLGVMAGGVNGCVLRSFVRKLAHETRREVPETYDRILFHRTRVEEALADELRCILGGPGPLFIVAHHETARAPLHVLEIDGKPLMSTQPVRYLPHGALLRQWWQKDCGVRVSNPSVIGNTRGDLDGAEREARVVGALLGVEPVLGEQATRDVILDALRTADIVHFSGHAGFVRNDYSKSGLAAFDGVVTADDVARIEVKASLVVLNACESGVHGIGVGAELQGFVRSLMTAGARQVICTLWRVKEKPAEEFANVLYDALLNGKVAPASAVRTAQLALRSAYPNEPEQWAPYICVG